MKPVHITLSNVSKRYDTEGESLLVLSNISMEIAPGSRVCILGRSGSGKSTLLNMLGTLDTPTEGTVLFNEQDIPAMSTDKIAHWRNENIGFIFQFHRLLHDFTALENIMLPGIIRGDATKELKKKALHLLTFLEMADRASHKPGKMSGGEQQRVAIARALICDPAVILADEPTGNLDYLTASAVTDLLKQITEERTCTLIVVTHNRELAKEMDQCYELSRHELKKTTVG